MSRVLLEGGIIVLLVLMGISVFIPNESGVSDVVVEFENSIESGNSVEDGELADVIIGNEENSNFIARLNCKIANIIVDGLNSIFDIGISVLREIIG